MRFVSIVVLILVIAGSFVHATEDPCLCIGDPCVSIPAGLDYEEIEIGNSGEGELQYTLSEDSAWLTLNRPGIAGDCFC